MSDEVLKLIEKAYKEEWLKLDLSFKGLKELPPEIGKLEKLQILELRYNQLSTLPSEIGKLEKLQILYLDKNQLSTLPPEIGKLEKLQILYLDKNQLTTLPPEIGKLEKLQTLWLHENHLTNLPQEIGELEKLQMLWLNNNRLNTLPPEIGKLENLQELDLRDNQLIILPQEIGKLKKMQELDIRYNHLTTLPKEIGELEKLQMLWLNNNRLNTLPPEIGKLENLQELYLDYNQLTTLPQELGNLEKMKRLYLDYNQLFTLPQEIWALGKMRVLDLLYNKITTLPPEIRNLKNLQILRLEGNLLTILPPEISKLEKLQTLDLQGNRLTTLPQEIWSLKELQLLDIRRNSLDVQIPPEILEKTDSPKTILNYYFEHKKAPTRPLNEVKLILVGQGGVGKTSLVNRLLYDKFNPDETKTPGIAINKWNIDVDGEKIQLNIWDFGGQEIMHATHQFFLTKRTVYILVLNARQGEHEGRLEYWLKLIQSYGGKSPVIVVCNKSEEHKIDLNWTGLQKKYPQVKGFVKEMSCKAGTGIEETKELIKQATGELEHIHDQLLETWFEVKDKLENMRKNFKTDFIPCSHYHKLCEERNINNKTSQKTLLGFLHDLGIVLCYQDDPRLEYMYVLNPMWVTEGVYQIMNSNELFQKKGVLEVEQLHKILDMLNKPGEERFPRDKHLFIVDMMRKFELCFDFEGTKDTKFLIPDLLPKEEQYTGEWDNSLEFQYHYDVLPGSVISRFIVRMHKSIHKNTYWRTGVVLKDGNNKALVKADIVDKKMYIYINDSEHTHREFLAKIRGQMDSIHKTIEGIKADEKVPIPGHPEVCISYKHLIRLERNRIDKYMPDGMEEKISVSKMLNGIESKKVRESKGQGNIHIDVREGGELIMDKKHYSGITIKNNTGQVAIGENITQTMTITQKEEAVKHIKELKDAVQKIDVEELPEEKKDWTLKELDKAIAEAEKEQPDKKSVAGYIKGAIETVKNSRILFSTASELATKLLPITTLLGLGAGSFGL